MGLSSTWTCCWSPWMVATTRYHKKLADLIWVPSAPTGVQFDLTWVTLHGLNLTLCGLNLIKWVIKVKFLTPWYFLHACSAIYLEFTDITESFPHWKWKNNVDKKTDVFNSLNVIVMLCIRTSNCINCLRCVPIMLNIIFITDNVISRECSGL